MFPYKWMYRGKGKLSLIKTIYIYPFFFSIILNYLRLKSLKTFRATRLFRGVSWCKWIPCWDIGCLDILNTVLDKSICQWVCWNVIPFALSFFRIHSTLTFDCPRKSLLTGLSMALEVKGIQIKKKKRKEQSLLISFNIAISNTISSINF